MPGAFGLLDGYHPSYFPGDRIVERVPRVDIRMLAQCGALVPSTITQLEIEPVGPIGDTGGGPRATRTVEVYREGPGVTIDGVFVRLSWDEAFGRERPWFVCPGPSCGRRVRHVVVRGGTIGCRKCFRLDYTSRHLRRQTPGVGRVERLRRKLGDCELKPFAPLPARIMRGRSRARHDALVAAIQAEEEALLGHLQKVARDLRRRIELRKARGEW